MKQVVFMFLCLMMSWTSSSASTTEVYSFDTYDIQLTSFRSETNHLAYQLQKIGQEPFNRVVEVEGANLHFTNIVEVEGNHVCMGNVLRNDQQRHYNGFIYVISPTGEDVIQLEFSYGENEDVRDVFIMNDVLMFVVRVATYNEQEQYEFSHYMIELFDYQYQPIASTRIDHEQDEFLASREMLLMDKEGDGVYDQAILQTGELIDTAQPLPIEPHEVFQKEVYIPFINEALVNGDSYYNGVFINFPGLYTLTYEDVDYSFQVESQVIGVADGAIYNEPVTPYVSNGQVYLNDDLYISGTPIIQPGDYTITVLGVGDYRKDVSFRITSALDGIYDNQTYQQDVSFTFNGTGYLNNTFITSPYEVTDPGDYILKIEGENNYQETYEFTIEEVIEGRSFVDFLQQYDLVILGITVVSGLLILKKK